MKQKLLLELHQLENSQSSSFNTGLTEQDVKRLNHVKKLLSYFPKDKKK